MIVAHILAALALLQGKPLQLQEYTVDAGHSIVEFSIGFALIHVKGRFNEWHGTILYDSINPSNSSITAILETKSIDTGWAHRDHHLRTSDFFDVERYPTITFQSERVRRTEAGLVADGSLTMHGVTRNVSLPFRLLPSSPARSAESRNMMLNLEGHIRLARTDFGIVGGSTYNSWFDKARAATVADTVDINFEVEAWRADAASMNYGSIPPAVERIATSGVATHIQRLHDQLAKVDSSKWSQYYRGQEFLVRALVWAGRERDALTVARAVAEFLPAATNAQLTLGFASDAAGDRKAAARAYTRARELFVPPKRDPTEQFPQVDDNWYYMDTLVRSLLEAGRTEVALHLAQVVADIYTDNARAQARYAETLALTNQAASAQVAFAKALQLDSTETRALEYRRRLLR